MGENTSYLRERVVAEFEKQRSLDEIAAFLPTVYHGGAGVVVDGEQYVAWMSTDGIRIAQGNTARYEREVQIISWEAAAERISELLDTGQYAGSWELERTAATERELLAQQIVYLYRDLADGQGSNFFPSFEGIKSGLFPDVTERVAAMLSDREQCEKLLGEYRDFLKAYSADRSVLRFNYHNTNEILSSLESQLLPRVQFHADTELIPSPHQFITQDEIDKLLRDGGSASGGKWQIFRYFTGEHSVEDKADFLKREYGIGGRSHALSDAPGSDEKHDSKGMELSKGGCENVRLTWRQVARRIDMLIASDRFMTALELAMYDTHTTAYASYNRAKPYHDNDIVLVQYGGAFYTYGADAETAAQALGQRTRQAGGLDYVEIMEEQIEPALDALSAYKPVTLNYEDGVKLTVDFHLPEDMRAQYEQRLYDALMSNESYANAVMNSDEENATLTGERVLREYVADSEDRDFQRTYYDNPSLREALNHAALDAAYHDMSEPPVEDEPELDDTPVNIQPREPMSSAYGVGDFVWFEGCEYKITDLQHGYVELLPPGMAIPVYRTARRADFERGLLADERNRYITDYLTTQTDNDAREQLTKTVAYYDAEKTHLPYDVVFQTIGSAPEPEPEPPAPNTPNNFRITDDHLGEGGAKSRFRTNMDAIHLLKQLEANGLAATAGEQETLSRYTGWGAIPEAFDDSKPEWRREFEELKAALTPEEYEAARGSTLNAHYTSPTVIRAIYDALGNMGFESGRILEPAMGVGNFFGLLPESMAHSELHGVELDSITGRIARQLYPEAEITVAGFETTCRPGFYDLAVGNVPFGNYQVFDPEYNRLGFSIHNYFAAKMLDQVRPGGIVAFVTSRYTMDSRDESVRRYLAARGELLGAIRLPNNAFRANAGTDVVTDVIFLQRREVPVTEPPEWVHVGENEDGFTVNRYFLDHPEMVLGTPTAESTQYGRQDYTVAPIEGAGLAEQLHEAIRHIHGEYTERDIEENTVSDIIPAGPDVRNYSYALVDGNVYFREGGIMVRQDVSAAMTERIRGMMELRDCTRRLIELQTMDAGGAEIAAEQKRLNELYDAFTAKHGLISSRENKRAFEDDSSYYLLCSLEILDDDG
ncbi:MAG TPA: helicase SNF2, partial [Candidatus Scatomorpha gallistercoris]|nr:helicase SNF2 [Candidatus Scatomorpha gallistercoris]